MIMDPVSDKLYSSIDDVMRFVFLLIYEFKIRRMNCSETVPASIVSRKVYPRLVIGMNLNEVHLLLNGRLQWIQNQIAVQDDVIFN